MSDFSEAIWAQAGKATRARDNAVRDALKRVRRGAVKKSLEEIPFASTKARQLSEDAELGWPHFAHVEPSAESGFTAADVRNILADLD